MFGKLMTNAGFEVNILLGYLKHLVKLQKKQWYIGYHQQHFYATS